MGERPGRELPTLGEAESPAVQRGDDVGVGRGVDDDRDALVVLGRRPDHGRPADVDLLDALVGAGPGRHRRGERVQVDDNEVERSDPEVLELGAV